METQGEREGGDAALASMQSQVVARSAMGTAFYLFSHQAGGHKPFLRSAKGEVCKPAIPLELQFYQALDTRFPQLKPFVPPFVGVITVDLHPVSPAVATTTTTATDPTASEMPSQADEEPLADNGPLHEPNHTTLHLQPEDGAAAALVTHSPSGKKRRLDTTRLSSRTSGLSLAGPTRSFMSTASYSATLWNKERPWADGSGSMRQSQCRQPRASAAGVTTREYLVLGDLTHAYSRPCVLDIKMGTRQHGEDAPPAKAASHSAKCAATTSLALGLRLCGMQVYDEVEQRYILWDKQWGRQLRQDGIEPALHKYLSNGSGLHRDSLRLLYNQLQTLQRVVRETTGVRFWGASLLLIYEGDRRQAERREDVHLIDFAHCQMSDALDSPDDGLLLGLSNLIAFIANIIARDHET